MNPAAFLRWRDLAAIFVIRNFFCRRFTVEMSGQRESMSLHSMDRPPFFLREFAEYEPFGTVYG